MMGFLGLDWVLGLFLQLVCMQRYQDSRRYRLRLVVMDDTCMFYCTPTSPIATLTSLLTKLLYVGSSLMRFPSLGAKLRLSRYLTWF